MTKGYQANKERLEAIALLGKRISKRAGFACEWCSGKEDLRPWDYKPACEPDENSIALLCADCRGLADGKKCDQNVLRSIRNALWSNVPAVAEGAACVLARSKESWVREAIEESFIDETVKTELLK